MFYKKITHGFVIQTFDENGKFVGQEFIAGDMVEWEDVQGNNIDEPDSVNYHPFNMSQE